MAAFVNSSVAGGATNNDSAVYGASLRSAVAAYKRGLTTRPIVITGLGDSNLAGQGNGSGSGTVPAYTDAFGYTPMQQMAAQAPTLAGLPVRTTAWFGDSNANILSTPVMEYNPKMTLGTGWNRTGFGGHLFGMFIAADAAAAGYFTYSFGSPITNVETYAIVNNTNSNSVGVYNSDNVLQGTFNTNNAVSSATKFTITGSFPDGIVKLRNLDASRTFYMMGQLAWNSAEKSIIVTTNAYAGSLVANYTQTSNIWDGMSFFPSLAPSATIVALTINDINGGTSSSSYTTSLTYILDFVGRYGTPIVSTGGNGSTAAWTNGQSDTIELAARKLAGAYGAQFVSMHKEWGSWAATNALGYEFDALHRTRLGSRDQGRVYKDVLRAMLGT